MTTTERILNYIESYQAQHHGQRPTYRQIGRALGISSHRTVTYHLIKSGAIIEYGKKRCDCGNMATTWLEVDVGEYGQITTKLPLCDDCAALEARLSKISSYRLR